MDPIRLLLKSTDFPFYPLLNRSCLSRPLKSKFYFGILKIKLNPRFHNMSRLMTKTNKMACLIRVFAVRMKKAWDLSYLLSAQRILWSNRADAQVDLSLCWACSHFVGFVMRQLIFWVQIFQTFTTLLFFVIHFSNCIYVLILHQSYLQCVKPTANHWKRWSVTENTEANVLHPVRFCIQKCVRILSICITEMVF